MKMRTVECTVSSWPRLGELLEYPGTNLGELVREAGERLGSPVPAASRALSEFLEATRTRSCDEMQEIYTRTFDIAAACVPWISVHLFGEESFKRAELMAGLCEAYERIGFEPGRELPDHIGLVLRATSGMSFEERRDLIRLCVLPALKPMIAALEKFQNPYQHILEAVQIVLEHQELGDVPDA